MKAASFVGQITSISARADGSIGFRTSTGELTKDQKTLFFDLQNLNCDFLIQPQDAEFPKIEHITTEVEGKTPSSRLRAVLYVMWKTKGISDPFDVWYFKQMNKIIDKIKEQIDT